MAFTANAPSATSSDEALTVANEAMFPLLGWKFATTAFGPFITSVAGFVDPERSPDQPVKLLPVLALAVTVTVWPLLYQVVPDGLTLPLPAGLTEFVRLYCVPKFAV
jgi:hypothetical protein